MDFRIDALRRSLMAAFAVPVLSIAALAGSDPAKPSSSDSMGPMVVPGIALSNFGIVDGRIYRGEQPKKDEYEALRSLGVTTIIDLRLDAKKNAKDLAEAAGLTYVNIPIDDHKQPSDDDVARFISLLESTPNDKVYVHCAGGRHRTGSMIAIYRMVHCGWNVEQAYNEMLAYDFYTRNGHKGFKTYVFEYFRRMQESPASVPVAYDECEDENATTENVH